MTKPRIIFDNSRARLEASAGLIRDLRPLIAYREMELPSVAAQHVIKGFMAKKRRYGMTIDHERLFQDPTAGKRLADLDYTPATLTARMFEGVMRQNGVWDGWTTLIDPSGHFGAGLVRHVERALTMRLDTPVELVDEREYHPAYPMSIPHPNLYDFQTEAVDAWFEAGGRGVIDLPPRSGKTHVAIGIAMRLGLPMLIVVPTIELVRQTVERFRDWLPDDMVMGVTGGRPNAKKQRQLNGALIWVATPATAAGPRPRSKKARRPGMKGIRSRKVLVIDEFHHAAASTWQDISAAATEAYYRLGLTGTHFRADGKDLAMHAVLSRSVYRRTVSEMIELGRLVPAHIAMVRVEGVTGGTGHALYGEGVVDHGYRNGLIEVAASWLVHLGKRVLILAKEVRHAEAIAASIDGAVQVDGRDNSVVSGRLKQLQAGTIKCLVGTSVIGEGVDVPAADALIYAAGGRSPVKHKQDYFRVLTASPGKTHGLIIDFADIHHPKLEEAAACRLGMYKSEEAFSVDVINPLDLPDWLQRAV